MRLTTRDLYESRLLHCAGAQPSDVWNECSKASTVIFVFDDSQLSDGRLEELQKSYHNGTAVVNLAEYRHSLESLKDVMFRLLRKENQNPRRNRNAKQSRSYQN